MGATEACGWGLADGELGDAIVEGGVMEEEMEREDEVMEEEVEEEEEERRAGLEEEDEEARGVTMPPTISSVNSSWRSCRAWEGEKRERKESGKGAGT